MSFPEHPGEKVGCVQVPAQERGARLLPVLLSITGNLWGTSGRFFHTLSDWNHLLMKVSKKDRSQESSVDAALKHTLQPASASYSPHSNSPSC